MNGNGDFNPQFLGDGSSSAPSQAFFYEQDTGLYHDVNSYPNTAYEIVKRGNKRMRIDDTQTTFYGPVQIDHLIPGTSGDTITLSQGSQSAPSLNFTGDSATGMWSDTKGDIDFSCNGTTAAIFSSSQCTLNNLNVQNVVSGPINAFGTISAGTNSLTCGALSTASISSSGNINNSPNSIGTGNIVCTSLISNGLINNAPNLLSSGPLNCSSITSTGQILAPVGSLSSPSYSFNGDTSTGIYRNITNDISISCGGTQAAIFQSNTSVLPIVNCTALQCNGTASTGTFSMTCGAMSCSSITSTGSITVPSGSSTSPSFHFSNSTNSGIYSNSLGTTDITSGGTSIVQVNSTGLTSGSNGMICGSLNCASLANCGSVVCGPLTSSNLKCGIGIRFNSFDGGTTGLASPNIAGSGGTYTSPTIPFNGTFSTTPTVIAGIEGGGTGNNWGNVISIVLNSTTTGFKVFLTNVGTLATVGSINISWFAFN